MPSATAWLIELDKGDGATHVVMRLDEADARQTLAEYFLDIGIVAAAVEAEELLSRATTRFVGVVW